MCQIASQTGDLLRRMRLVAGRGAMAKRMAALWQRAVGKMLLAGAPWRRCWQEHHQEDAAGKTAVAKHHREETAGRPAARSAKG